MGLPFARGGQGPLAVRYLALNKPYGVLSRFTDPHGRPTLKDHVDVPGVYPVGRLDFDSEGLLLLTDDARFQHRVTRPGSPHEKVYLVQVERIPTEEALQRLRQGVVLDGRLTLPARVSRIDPPDLPERPVPIRFRKNVPDCWLEIALREGRNRQVRRMTAAVGHPTLRLVRQAVGPVTLEGLAPGCWRDLRGAELSWARR